MSFRACLSLNDSLILMSRKGLTKTINIVILYTFSISVTSFAFQFHLLSIRAVKVKNIAEDF